MEIWALTAASLPPDPPELGMICPITSKHVAQVSSGKGARGAGLHCVSWPWDLRDCRAGGTRVISVGENGTECVGGGQKNNAESKACPQRHDCVAPRDCHCMCPSFGARGVQSEAGALLCCCCVQTVSLASSVFLRTTLQSRSHLSRSSG